MFQICQRRKMCWVKETLVFLQIQSFLFWQWRSLEVFGLSIESEPLFITVRGFSLLVFLIFPLYQHQYSGQGWCFIQGWHIIYSGHQPLQERQPIAAKGKFSRPVNKCWVKVCLIKHSEWENEPFVLCIFTLKICLRYCTLIWLAVSYVILHNNIIH